MRVTIGGDRLDYTYDTSTQTTSLDINKVLLNSPIFMSDVWFMTENITYFYHGTLLANISVCYVYVYQKKLLSNKSLEMCL